jgi:hypothetical protein
MHAMTEGYIVPAAHALGTADEQLLPAHPQYRQILDQVRAHLAGEGLPTCNGVRGTLPLGHGFAGSTALALLHLGADAAGSAGTTLASAEAIVSRIDGQIHGFAPSGVDYHSVAAGEAGYFGPDGWRPTRSPPRLSASALLMRDDSDWPLSETRHKVVAAADKLVPIARHLCSALRTRAFLDYQALFDYAVQLRRINIYLPHAATIVDHALRYGLVAKGVGGLTNKAVIIVWRPGMPVPMRGRILRELRSHGADATLWRI